MRNLPSLVLHYIWGNESGDNLSGDMELLRNVVNEFVSFISTSQEQIPPNITEEEIIEWNTNKSTLIIFLNVLMPTKPVISQEYNDIVFPDKHKRLVRILDHFIEKIDIAYQEYIAKA